MNSHYKNSAVVALLGSLALLATPLAHASVIDFEDYPTRASFHNLGIASSYQGYSWGYGDIGLPAYFPSNAAYGWAFQSAGDPAYEAMPTGGSGVAAAWNWNGLQSLWIDFKTSTDVASGKFAVLSRDYITNASTVQLFGYTAEWELVETSAILQLGDRFRTLNANFKDIQYLEIRTNEPAWFSVDDIVINEEAAAVPEPASFALFGLGMAGLGLAQRRRRMRAT